MRTQLLALAALSCLAALTCLAAPSGARAADYDGRLHPIRPLIVTRVVFLDCQPRPTIVAPGRRGMGEPGTFYARWDWLVPEACLQPR